MKSLFIHGAWVVDCERDPGNESGTNDCATEPICQGRIQLGSQCVTCTLTSDSKVFDVNSHGAVGSEGEVGDLVSDKFSIESAERSGLVTIEEDRKSLVRSGGDSS